MGNEHTGSPESPDLPGLEQAGGLPRGWRAEWVVSLFFGLILAVGVGGLTAQLMARVVRTEATASQSPMVGVVSNGVIHLCIFYLVNRLLRQQGWSWSRAFGFGVGSVGKSLWAGFCWGGALLLMAYPILWGVGWLLEQFGIPAPAQDSVEHLLKSESWTTRLMLGFFAVGVAPWVEEILFRGVLFSALKDWGFPRLAWYGTAALFAAIHMNRAALVPLFVVGLVLARVYERTGNLLASVAAHATFNLAPFVAVAIRQWS